KHKTRDSIRQRAGAIGAIALIAGVMAIVVMVRMPPTPQPNAAPPTPEPRRVQAAPTMTAVETSAPTPQTAARPETTTLPASAPRLAKRHKVSGQAALDGVLGARKAGQGWAAFARGLDLKIADVLTDVRNTDRQVARLVTLKAAR